MAAEIVKAPEPGQLSVDNKLEIIDDVLRKKYLARLSDMDVAAVPDYPDIEDDVIDNVRLYKISEMVYRKGEPVTDKLTTVFNALSTYNVTLFALVDSDGTTFDFYLGVRNNDPEGTPGKRSTVTLGDTLKQTLLGHFPGVKIEDVNRKAVKSLSEKIASLNNVSSVSVVGSQKTPDDGDGRFVQGLEKLLLTMSARPFMGLLVANSQSPADVQAMRRDLQSLFTKLSPYRSLQISDSSSSSSSRSLSFFEMDKKQKAAMLAASTASLVGSVGGALVGAAAGSPAAGSMIGGQVAGQLGGLMNSLVPNEQTTRTTSQSLSSTVENRGVADMLEQVDQLIRNTEEYDSFGLWSVAGYFCSNDMAAAEIAASNYRSLMNGDESGREVSAINSWRRLRAGEDDGFGHLVGYLSRFVHPQFVYEGRALVDASTSVSGKELGLHLGIPRTTVPGLPVIEHAEFGKEVTTYRLISDDSAKSRNGRISLGRIFDLGRVMGKAVELDSRSLNMHTFVTGSTGSGKSNAVYLMLSELRHEKIPFLVVEPAKGEYKDAFGHLPDVEVFSTNPEVARLVHINPFRFPRTVHVLEHVDGLVEIFSACWPMYDAMPAFFKDAILRSYEAVGWDLGSSTFYGDVEEYPDFEIVSEQLDELIGNSEYASDIKSNYRGALLTRVRSLTVGLNKYVFSSEQTPYEQLFDSNCILDISRVRSSETKALIMGLMVYILNEYRMDQRSGSNKGLRHVTVLEEAHNLLKAPTGSSSDLVSKSVEMISNTIAEIRTYGEGFVIVDQSPSAVDASAIKNTNTKIVLRTPEIHDREAVGRSMGLLDDQIDEIAKLPSGVAVVYQNDWACPVLALLNKAPVEERPYECRAKSVIKPAKEARSSLARMLMQPWIEHGRMTGEDLKAALRCVDVDRATRAELMRCVDDYVFCGGRQIWREGELGRLSRLLRKALGFSDAEFARIVESGSPDNLRRAVRDKTQGLAASDVEEICNILTISGGE